MKRLAEMGVEGGILDFTGDEDALATLRDFTLPRLQARLKLSSTITMRTVALRQILSLLFWCYSLTAMNLSQ